MKSTLAILVGCLGVTAAAMAAPLDPDRRMDSYFSIWADNARVTPEAVDRLYASRVIYYGKPMTPGQVYRDKLNYIRQWPDRIYRVVPGSVSRSCTPGQDSCRITAILSWQKADRSGRRGSKGANTITLTLVREDGALKIARESGTPVARSACWDAGGRWRCSGYR